MYSKYPKIVRGEIYTFPVEITITDASGNVVYNDIINVSGLNVSESTTLTFNWTPNNTGEYNITAVVDSNYTINESNFNGEVL